MTALVLFDLSAAFDVINRGILQKCLEYSFGVTEELPPSFIEATTTEGKCLKFGLSQGSVLEPRKYCLYSKPISPCASNIICVTIAIQMTFTHLCRNNAKQSIGRRLNQTGSLFGRYQCLDECKYHVKPRKDRTNCLQAETSIDKIQLHVGEKTDHIACSLKNLGIYMVTSLTMEREVNTISNACY